MTALVYVSSAVRLFSPSDLLDLLEVSRRNNQRDDITGLLLYRGGNFMQLLEGEDAAIVDAHARISRDPRHRGIITLLQERVSDRLFDEWAMAFGNLDDPALRQREGVSEFLHVDFTDPSLRGDGNRCLSLLKSFRRSMR